MKYIVDRRTWYRGKGADASKLLRADGQRCCIGFVGQQCGIPDKNLLDIKDVISTTFLGRNHVEETAWPAWMRPTAKSGGDIGSAYWVNDDRYLTEGEREKHLKAIFADNGDEIEFVN